MEKIDDIVATLSPEERELHKDLIKECREREVTIIHLGQEIRENIDRLNEVSMKIMVDFDRFYQLAKELNKNCKNVKGNIIRDSISLIPDDKFYYA
ncbi:MAG: hypothetical protein V1874_17635 [Spirochaetota bacterium]